jgi:hypothetical protein
VAVRFYPTGLRKRIPVFDLSQAKLHGFGAESQIHEMLGDTKERFKQFGLLIVVDVIFINEIAEVIKVKWYSGHGFTIAPNGAS